MFPQVLIICQNSRLRRLYHQIASRVECEVKPCSTIAEALVQILLNSCHVIVIDESVPIFEVSVFMDVFAKKSEWQKAQIIAIGFDNQRQFFPPHVLFCRGESDFESVLKDVSARL